MRKSISLLAAFALAAVTLQAQVTLTPTVVSSGGGYFQSENMSISWTLGELAITTLSSNNMVLTQGFQQPFDLDVGLSSESMSWGVSVYPNPVGEQLRIRFDIRDPGDYLIEVQDVTGRLVSQQHYRQVAPGDIILLNTSTYTTGVYFLKVMTGDRQQVQVTSLRKL